MNNKYLIIDGCFPIIFHGGLTHKEVAAHYKGKVTSAGFFLVGYNVVTPYGESVSLKLKSNKDDEVLLTKLIFGD